MKGEPRPTFGPDLKNDTNYEGKGKEKKKEREGRKEGREDKKAMVALLVLGATLNAKGLAVTSSKIWLDVRV